MRIRTTMLLLIAFASQISAHGTADNHLQIMVIDNRVKMNIVVDMRVLGIADVDADGYASLEELAAGSHEIKKWVRQSINVRDGGGNPGDVVFADITSDLNIAHANGDRVDHARILQTVTYPNSVTGLQLDLDKLVGVVPEVTVTIIDAATGMKHRLRAPHVAQTILLPTSRENG